MKLTESQLRRIIRNETKTVIKEFTHPRRGLASLIFEEDEKKPVDNDKGVINIAAGPESVLKAASSLIADEEKKKT